MTKINGIIQLTNVPISSIEQEKIETPIKTYWKIKIKEGDKLNLFFYSWFKIEFPEDKKYDKCDLRLVPNAVSKEGNIVFRLDSRDDVWDWWDQGWLHQEPVCFLLNDKDQKELDERERIKNEQELEKERKKQEEYRSKCDLYLNEEWIPMVIKFVHDKNVNYKDWIYANWMHFLSTNNFLKQSNKIKYPIVFNKSVLKLILDKLN